MNAEQGGCPVPSDSRGRVKLNLEMRRR